MDKQLAELREYLQELPPGKIEDDTRVARLLEECWGCFSGTTATNMVPEMVWRGEDFEWEPPVLRFAIERHGGTVHGSSRADLYTWYFDLDTLKAGCGEPSYRQVRPRQKPLNVKPIAEEVARLIRERQEDPRLEWHKDGRVRVVLSEILPERYSPKQTREGRRGRFWSELDRLLRPDWERPSSRHQTYHPKAH